MKPIILAFILSIVIHLLLFFQIDFEKKEKPKPVTSGKSKNSTVRYVKLMPKAKPTPKVEKKVEKKVQKQQPKRTENRKVYKKVEPKKIQAKKQTRKVVKKPLQMPPKKTIAKKKIPNKIIKKAEIKPQEKRKTVPEKNLENFLLKEPEPIDKNMLDQITQSYLKLYGEEYEDFTKVQKVFIQNNIKRIVNITRRYYNFPPIALKLKKDDFNVVEFTLHPNGDITNLHIVKKGNYSYYDKSIIETIEFAYKDYPRPKQPTKIKFYITYKVY